MLSYSPYSLLPSLPWYSKLSSSPFELVSISLYHISCHSSLSSQSGSGSGGNVSGQYNGVVSISTPLYWPETFEPYSEPPEDYYMDSVKWDCGE